MRNIPYEFSQFSYYPWYSTIYETPTKIILAKCQRNITIVVYYVHKFGDYLEYWEYYTILRIIFKLFALFENISYIRGVARPLLFSWISDVPLLLHFDTKEKIILIFLVFFICFRSCQWFNSHYIYTSCLLLFTLSPFVSNCARCHSLANTIIL